MKETPILFSAPMVRAILEGRKTQTRRVMNPQPVPIPADTPRMSPYDDWGYWWACKKAGQMVSLYDAPCMCSYGHKGDRLWVRETYRVTKGYDGLKPTLAVVAMGGDYAYCVDYLATPFPKAEHWGKKRVSIHMPRQFSRIKLEITAVGVERLQDITEADCIAEGVSGADGALGDDYISLNGFVHGPCGYSWPKARYADLWTRINGAGSWADNPWVWRVEFRRVTP